MKDNITLRADQIKNLISLADERNLSVPVTSSDVDEIVTAEGLSETDKLRALGRFASIVHEVLYAPPGR